MCLRPRLPQLPVRHKPPNTPRQTEENLQKKNRKIAGFSAQSFGKTQLCLQRASFISLCYCKCASIQACFENIALPFLAALSIFVSPFSEGIGFAFIPARGLTSTHYVPCALARPSHTCHPPPFCCSPRQAPNHPFVFGTRIGNPSHHSKIFSFRLAL